MCGIAGIWGQASNQRLRAMADSLRHRGPDDQGCWTSPSGDLGLAHRRLSIIDLTGGRQPIASEDGQVVTVFNGEIYNYRELRTELIARGHRFSTQSDTEVIVHLYEECGTEVATKLRGMFAVAIWDNALQQLVLIRDRVGKKPLYYRETDGEFLFASEIKGIVAGAREMPSIDRQGIADYLTWGVIPAPGTVYQHVRSVEPGQIVVISNRRVVSRTHYWQLKMLPKTKTSKCNAIEQIDQQLRDAIRLRLRSDVPVGCFLSGGIDSGIVTAMAAQESAQRLTTITVGFEDGTFDERPLARLVASQYDTDHHEIVIRPNIESDLGPILANYDQPFGDSSAIPSYYVAKGARQHVKVVLNGDGGDELLAGYRRYVAARISGLLSWADGSVSRSLGRMITRALPTPRGYRSGYAFAHRLLRGMGLDPVSQYLAWSLDGIDLRDLQAPDLAGPPGSLGGPFAGLQSADRFARSRLGTLGGCRRVDQMLGTDFATVLPNDLLVKIDIATMAHGLEARSPFLDHELVETVARFPESIKLGGMRTKPLLRELSSRYLPNAIQTAPKRGFEVPLVRWLNGKLREMSHDVILSRNGLLAELFDRAALRRLLCKETNLDPARWSRHVWLLLALGMWDSTVRNGPASTFAGSTDSAGC